MFPLSFEGEGDKGGEVDKQSNSPALTKPKRRDIAGRSYRQKKVNKRVHLRAYLSITAIADIMGGSGY